MIEKIDATIGPYDPEEKWIKTSQRAINRLEMAGVDSDGHYKLLQEMQGLMVKMENFYRNVFDVLGKL